MDPDLAAVQRLQQGDVNAIRPLIEAHRDAVFRLAWRYLRNEADAAEVTEETFFKVYRNAPRYRPRGRVKSWIFTIAANLCRDALRRRKKQHPLVSIHDSGQADEPDSREREVPAMTPDPGGAAEQDEAVARIESAIQSLPEKLRFPFIFCVLEDHSYDECAEVLDTNRKTVETRIYRARKKMQDALVGLKEPI